MLGSYFPQVSMLGSYFPQVSMLGSYFLQIKNGSLPNAADSWFVAAGFKLGRPPPHGGWAAGGCGAKYQAERCQGWFTPPRPSSPCLIRERVALVRHGPPVASRWTEPRLRAAKELLSEEI